jgi:hypothetical protein
LSSKLQVQNSSSIAIATGLAYAAYRNRRSILVGAMYGGFHTVRAFAGTSKLVAGKAIDVAGVVLNTVADGCAAIPIVHEALAVAAESLPEPYAPGSDHFGLVDLAMMPFQSERYRAEEDAVELRKLDHQDKVDRLQNNAAVNRAIAYDETPKYVWQQWWKDYKIEAFDKHRDIEDRDHKLYLDSLNELERIQFVTNGLSSRLDGDVSIEGADIPLRGVEFARSIVRNMGDPLQFTGGKLYGFLLARAEVFIAARWPAEQRETIMKRYDRAIERVCSGWYPSSFSR